MMRSLWVFPDLVILPIPALFIAGAGLAALAQPAASETGVTDYQVENGFYGEGPADLSGLACIPIDQGKAYRCLAVNDENQTAQFARVEDGKIEAGEEIRLIGESPDPETVGARPRSVPCPKITHDFEELDGRAFIVRA